MAGFIMLLFVFESGLRDLGIDRKLYGGLQYSLFVLESGLWDLGIDRMFYGGLHYSLFVFESGLRDLGIDRMFWSFLMRGFVFSPIYKDLLKFQFYGAIILVSPLIIAILKFRVS